VRSRAGYLAVALLALFFLLFFLAVSLDAMPPTAAVVISTSLATRETSDEDRKFYRREVAAVAVAPPGSPSVPTHLELQGWATYRKLEKDGDIHLHMCDGDVCLILECIPDLPEIAKQCAALRVPVKVLVRGISHYDPEHRWQEIHPVLSIQEMP